MTELATQELARARAARIRAGIQTYLHTLADIAGAYAQRDWAALRYESWQAYIDGEYSETRLRLTKEHRQKAVEELRLAGLSTPAIAAAVGISRNTVAKDLAQSEQPAEIQGADGKTYAATRPQTPAASPEPEPEASTFAGSGHGLPAAEPSPDDDLAAGRTVTFGSVEEMDAALDGAAERYAEPSPARPEPNPLDDPEHVAETLSLASSARVANGLVALYAALHTDPIRWMTTSWRPTEFMPRNLPFARDAFTADGLRTIADRLATLAGHLDKTGASL